MTLPFDAATPAGLYELTWNSSAPLGFTNAGNFVLNAEWWNGDPSAGGSFSSAAPNSIQPYSATVTTATPEPATVGLVGLVLLAIPLRLRTARRRRSGGEPSHAIL